MRACGLEAWELDAQMLPAVRTLDLSDNALSEPSAALCSLLSLRVLRLAHNALTSLLAPLVASHRRAWVPRGLHELEGLRELSIAQNRVRELPPPFVAGLAPLLRDLDVRCNPLCADAQHALARLMHARPPAAAEGAAEAEAALTPRVRMSAVRRVAPRLLVGDPSVAWDERTLKALGVTHIVTVGEPSELGALTTHARPVRAGDPRVAPALAVLGLGGLAPDETVDAAAARAAYLRAARELHPDALPAGAPDETRRRAEERFSHAREAYAQLCDAGRAEAVELPRFGEFAYHVCPLGAGAGEESAVGGDEGGARALTVRALGEASAFIHAARTAPLATVVLVHAAAGWGRAAAVAAAYALTALGRPLGEALALCAPPATANVVSAGSEDDGPVALPPRVRAALVELERAVKQHSRRVHVHVEPGARVADTADSRSASGSTQAGEEGVTFGLN